MARRDPQCDCGNCLTCRRRNTVRKHNLARKAQRDAQRAIDREQGIFTRPGGRKQEPPSQLVKLAPGPFISRGGYLDYEHWPDRDRFLELDKKIVPRDPLHQARCVTKKYRAAA